MNNKILLLIFLVLLVIYLLAQLFSSKKESSFQAELIAVDTSTVTGITIDPKGEEKAFTLKREGTQWIVTDGKVGVKAVSGRVNALLENLTLIRTQRIAAKSPEKWSEYEVAEGEGSRIKIHRDDELLEEFIIGRFSFNQQAQSGTSFIRLAGQDEVYAVDGFQMMTMGQGMNAYRNRRFVQLQPDATINNLVYQAPDSMYRFSAQGNQWTRSDTTPLDSTEITNYINVLRNLSGQYFADDFNELQADRYALESLLIGSAGIADPIRIDAYRDSTRERPFVLRSSQYPDVFFESDSSGLYQRIFEPLASFLENE